MDRDPRKFAHSLRFVFPKITAPTSRSFCTMNASRGAIDPASASDPAVVIIWSCVSMLSLMRTGTPCSGPRSPLGTPSSLAAICRALGFTSMTEFRAGPDLSNFSMRFRYSLVTCSADRP